jgi:acetyl esterase/lipase
MNVLILGGNSPRHKEWVRQVAEALRPYVGQAKCLIYRHWGQGGDADVTYEIEQAAQMAKSFSGEYIIIAKSVGTVITTLGVDQRKLHPSRCIFLGFPLSMMQHVPAAAPALTSLPPTVIVQNEHDPLGSYQDVRSFLSKLGNKHIAVTATPGETHDYVDFAQIRRLVLSGA